MDLDYFTAPIPFCDSGNHEWKQIGNMSEEATGTEPAACKTCFLIRGTDKRCQTLVNARIALYESLAGSKMDGCKHQQKCLL